MTVSAHDFNTSVFGQLKQALIPLPRIPAWVPLKHEVTNLPPLKQLWQQLDWVAPNDEKLRVCIDGLNGVGYILHRLQKKTEAIDANPVLVDVLTAATYEVSDSSFGIHSPRLLTLGSQHHSGNRAAGFRSKAA